LGLPRGRVHAKVDSSGIERMQRTKDLSHLEGRVMRQHDSARTDADSAGLRAHARQQDLRRSARERFHGVVLRHPVAGVAEAVREPGKLNRILQRLGRRAAGGHRSLVQNSKLQPGVVACCHYLYWMCGWSSGRKLPCYH